MQSQSILFKMSLWFVLQEQFQTNLHSDMNWVDWSHSLMLTDSTPEMFWAPETLTSQVGLTLLEAAQAPEISFSQPLCFLWQTSLYSGVCGKAVRIYGAQLSSPWALCTAKERGESCHTGTDNDMDLTWWKHTVLFTIWQGKKDNSDQIWGTSSASCFQNVLQRLFCTEQHQHSQLWCCCTDCGCSGQPIFLIYFFSVVSSHSK